ncbi:MAG: DarT ssDNA thymidine ADP-ribosyltransferase family protein [Sulfurimonas sp.]|nr:DarT ssDNA thymidine ADP-ribosyltransferase family protein [Sulfurimonas sp.]
MNIQEILNNHGINSIWHFTDRSNIGSIEENGLLPLNTLLKEKIEVSRYGASDSSHRQDIRKGLDKCIHLSFIQDHPMYHIAKRDGRIVDPVWIEIDIDSMTAKNTLFSNILANTYNAKIFKSDELEEIINFDTILYEKDFYTRKEARKAEIMIFNSITTNQIKGIYNGK